MGVYNFYQMMDQSPRDAAVLLCTFQLTVLTANVHIKFPCNYFVEWKTGNGRKVVEGTARPTALHSVVEFAETLEMTTEMIREAGRYFKKETQLNLNLVSKARQDQVKLVGRVSVDLAELANSPHPGPRTHRLAYCSVEADITFSAVMKSQRPTSLAPHELDKSSFNDYFSLYSAVSRDHAKREALTECEQETSIGYRTPLENVIDGQEGKRDKEREKERERERGQMFFYVPGGRMNNLSCGSNQQIPLRSKERQQNYIHSDFSLRSPPVIRPTPTSLPKPSKQQKSEPVWQEKTRFREQIDGNKQKIQELQRKIYELCVNLEDSKRNMEASEKMNKEKEELIRQLKKPEAKDNHLHLKEYIELEERCERMQRDRKDDDRRNREAEEALRKQIALYEANLHTLTRETDEMRKMWIEKKEHMEEKLRFSEDKIREREDKIREREGRVRQLQGKLEEALKFKYQYELVKELTEEKDHKLRLVEKDLNRITHELQELLKNNPTEELYQLRHAHAHSTRTIDDLQAKLTRSEEEITKYKENYVKMETAYHIQAKNYNTAIEKQSQIETAHQSLQKEHYELKNHLAATLRRSEEYELRYNQTQDERQQLAKAYEELSNSHRNSAQQLSAVRNQMQAQKVKLKTQLQAKQLQLQQKIWQLQVNTRSNLQIKDQQFEQLKQELQAQLLQLQQQNNQLQLHIQSLQQHHARELESKLQQITRMETLVAHQQAALRQAETVAADTEAALTEAVATLQSKERALQLKQTELASTQHALLSTEDALKTSEDALRQIQDMLTHKEEALRQKEILIKLNTAALREKQTANLQLQTSINDKITTISQLQQEICQVKTHNNELLTQVEEHTANQKQLQQNIALLEEESQKILFILEHKQEIEQELIEIRSAFTTCMFELEEEKAKSSTLQLKLHETLQQLQGKQEEVGSKISQLEEYNYLLEEYKRSQQAARQEAADAHSELSQLKGIIRQINDRYEEHVKIEERFQEELHHLRSEKEETEAALTNSNHQLLQHVAQLEEQLAQLHCEVERMEAEHSRLIDEKIHYERTAAEQTRHANSRSQESAQLLGQIEELQRNRDELHQRIDQKDKEIVLLSCSNTELNTQIGQLHSNLQQLEAAVSKEQTEKDDLHAQLQQQIDETAQLEAERDGMMQEINELRSQPEVILSQYGQPTTSIIHAEDHPEHNSHLHQLLLESDRKNQALEQQVLQLLQQMEQMSRQASSAIFTNFHQFSNQQLQKIVDEQRVEINRLEEQRNRRAREVAGLELKVKELEKNIVELEATFKMEIDRLSTDRNSREGFHSELTVIAEERDEEDVKSCMYSASRVKSSMDGDLHEMRERIQTLTDEKVYLQQQLQAIEEEKFSLLSAINEKDIELEDTHRSKMIAELERDELQAIVPNLREQIRRLEEDNEILKCQANFGSTLNFNQNSVTRSEPIRSEQDNHHAEIQALKAQIDRYRSRQQQMSWNMRDLQMQLQTVTENLNALNASNMNSVLSSRVSHHEREEEEGYSKERLLLSLRRNEQLKQISHNLIRALRQRDQQAQLMVQSASESRLMMEQLTANAAEIDSLLREFQSIKIWVLKMESGKLQAEASKLLGEMREADIMKNLLAFQSHLLQITQSHPASP